MTAEVQAEGAPPGRTPTPYTERIVTHVTPDVDERLRMQAALERRPPAHVLNEVLAAGLLTLSQIKERIAERMQQMGEGNGSGSH